MDSSALGSLLSTPDWGTRLEAVAQRFDREVGIQMGEPAWDLPEDLKHLPFNQACQRDHLLDRLSVPFYQVREPQKQERCLDLGCGVSFLIYPWSHWGAYFHGHELSPRVVQMIQSRAPQLNPKLFKSMHKGPAHLLEVYDTQQFDVVIATGFLYYYPLEYVALIWERLQPYLKPSTHLLLEWVNTESPWVEEWGLTELFKGTEPQLIDGSEFEQQIKDLGGQIVEQASGELFTTYLIRPQAPPTAKTQKRKKA